MKVNTHGIKMVGLKKAAGETKHLNGCNGCYVQISYDRADGEVLADYHCSLGHNSWSQYRQSSIINICFLDYPTTMQEIADRIADRLAINESDDEWD